MQNQTRARLLLTIAVAALSGCTLEVDPLGLSGTYGGSFETAYEGSIEVQEGGGLNGGDVEQEKMKDGTLFIEAGIDSDAVLTGALFRCPIPLDIDGDELRLQGSVDCLEEDSEDEAKIGSTTYTSSATSRAQFFSLVVRDVGNGQIQVDATGTSSEERHGLDGEKTTAEMDFTLMFDGEQLAH